jgi:hypothetical protein
MMPAITLLIKALHTSILPLHAICPAKLVRPQIPIIVRVATTTPPSQHRYTSMDLQTNA